MRKQFGKPKPKTKTPKKRIADAKTVMTSEMRKAHGDFFGNMERLESEWNLCNDQYDITKKLSLTKESTFDARMLVRKVSTYWNKRKIALETALEKDEVKKFKDKRANLQATKEPKK
jgi:hypothetical protein